MAENYTIFACYINIYKRGYNYLNGFPSLIHYHTSDAYMRLLYKGQQRILVHLPELGQFGRRRVLAAGQLEGHLEAVRVDVVEVLHATWKMEMLA